MKHLVPVYSFLNGFPFLSDNTDCSNHATEDNGDGGNSNVALSRFDHPVIWVFFFSISDNFDPMGGSNESET